MVLCGWYYYDTEMDTNRSLNTFVFGVCAAIGHHSLCALKMYLIANHKYFVQKDLICGCNTPQVVLSMAFCTNLLTFLLTIVWIEIFQSEQHSHVLYTQLSILLRLVRGDYDPSGGDDKLFSIGLGFCVLLAFSKICMFLFKYVTFRKQNQNRFLFLLLNTRFHDDDERELADTADAVTAAAAAPRLKMICTSSVVSQSSTPKNANSSTVVTETGFAHLPQNGNLSMVAMLDAIARTLWLVLCMTLLNEALSVLLLACWAIMVIVVYISCQMLSQSLFLHSTYSWLTFAHNSQHVMYSNINSMLLSVAYKFYFNFKFYVYIVRNRKVLPLNMNNVTSTVSTSAARAGLQKSTASNIKPLPSLHDRDELQLYDYDSSMQVTRLKPSPSEIKGAAAESRYHAAVKQHRTSLPKALVHVEEEHVYATEQSEKDEQVRVAYVDVTPPPPNIHGTYAPSIKRSSFTAPLSVIELQKQPVARYSSEHHNASVNVKILRTAAGHNQSNVNHLKVELSNLSYELSTIESNEMAQVLTQHEEQHALDTIHAEVCKDIMSGEGTGREKTPLSSPSISTPTPQSVAVGFHTPHLTGNTNQGLPVIKADADEEGKHVAKKSISL